MRIIPLFVLLATALLLNGCAAYRNYDQEMQQTTDEMTKGNLTGALALVEMHNSWEDKDLLYYLETGAILSAGSALPESQQAMRTLRDDMPEIISRAMFRANMAAIGQAQENDRNPAKASLVVTKQDPLEEADTRTWRALPDMTLVTRVRLKKGLHKIDVPFYPPGHPLTLRVDQAHQILNLCVFRDQTYYVGSAFVAPATPLPEK